MLFEPKCNFFALLIQIPSKHVCMVVHTLITHLKAFLGFMTLSRDCHEKNDKNVFVHSGSHGDFLEKCMKYTVIFRLSAFKQGTVHFCT